MTGIEAARRFLSDDEAPVNMLHEDKCGDSLSFPFMKGLDDYQLLTQIHSEMEGRGKKLPRDLTDLTQKQLAGSRLAITGWHIDRHGLLTIVKAERGSKI